MIVSAHSQKSWAPGAAICTLTGRADFMERGENINKSGIIQ